MNEGSVKLSLRQVTPELRAAISAESLEADHPMRDTVLLALAEYFGLDVTLSGRAYRAYPGYSQFLEVFIPDEIHVALWRESQRTRYTANSCCLAILSQRYGIPYEPVFRSRGRRMNVNGN